MARPRRVRQGGRRRIPRLRPPVAHLRPCRPVGRPRAGDGDLPGPPGAGRAVRHGRRARRVAGGRRRPRRPGGTGAGPGGAARPGRLRPARNGADRPRPRADRLRLPQGVRRGHARLLPRPARAPHLRRVGPAGGRHGARAAAGRRVQRRGADTGRRHGRRHGLRRGRRPGRTGRQDAARRGHGALLAGAGRAGAHPGHRADARRRLYALVRRAEESGLDCDPNRLYVSAMDAFDPPLPEGGFGSCGRPPPTCSGRCRTRRRWPASPTG